MKSKLQLEWLVCNKFCMEMQPSSEIVSKEMEVTLKFEIHFDSGGEHLCFMNLVANDPSGVAIKLETESMGRFSYDFDDTEDSLLPVLTARIAENMASLLYSSERERTSIFTSRTPYGEIVLPAQHMEDDYFTLTFDELLRKRMHLPEQEMSGKSTRMRTSKKTSKSKKTAKKSAAKKS